MAHVILDDKIDFVLVQILLSSTFYSFYEKYFYKKVLVITREKSIFFSLPKIVGAIRDFGSPWKNVLIELYYSIGKNFFFLSL